MAMFLDPHGAGCTVWFSGGNIQTLRGSLEEICIRIRNHVMDVFEDDDGKVVRRVQRVSVYLDTMGGIGKAYEIVLNELGVKFDRCTYQKFIQ